MDGKTIGGIIVALVVLVGGYFGYQQYTKPAAAPAAATAPAAPAAPAASTAPAAPAGVAAALPAAALAQLKTGIDQAVGAIPNITPDQKTKVGECLTKAVTAAVKPEDAAKLATDAAAQQALMTQVTGGMQACMKEAGLPAQ